MALHFKCLPTELEEDQISDYLHLLKQEHNTPSDSYFKHSVFGLRMLCKVEHIKPHDIGLPSIKRPNKLPVVLSKAEMWSLLQAPDLLKHKILIGLLYGCGLRCLEARIHLMAGKYGHLERLKIVEPSHWVAMSMVVIAVDMYR